MKINSTLLAVGSLAVSLFCWCSPATAQQTENALSQLTLQQLMQLQVSSASGYSQASDTAPASVSVVTAEDIQMFGFRTLTDILRSVRSLFVIYDRNYSSLGVRGIARPGDLNTRVLLLIDGHRMNDDIFSQALLGTDFPLDVDMIQRVEVVRGPVSSLYGSNALLGVINVITRRGQELGGAQVASSVGSFNSEGVRLSYGQRKGDVDFLATATLFRSKGHNSLYYPEFDAAQTNGGLASHIDHDNVRTAFVAATIKEFTFHALFGTRAKQIPTASYGTIFNDPGTSTVDTHTLFDLQDNHQLSKGWQLLSRGFYDIRHYSGRYAYPSTELPSGQSPEIDQGYGQWGGGELKATNTTVRNIEVLGVEFRNNLRQTQKTYYLNPTTVGLNDHRTSFVVAPFVEYERPVVHRFGMNLGVRYDYYSDTASSWDPRFAFIYRPQLGTTVRFAYGASFRAPTVFERYYAILPNAPNPELQPERVRTFEAMWDQTLPAHFKLATSAFHTQISGLINQVGDAESAVLKYKNSTNTITNGVESELSTQSRHFPSASASYTFQESRDQTINLLLTNSPRQLGKLNLAASIPRSTATLGVNALYVSRMSTVNGSFTSPYTIVNATLQSHFLRDRLQISASAYNVLDKQYADPAPGYNEQQSIAQDGRSVRIKMIWTPHHL